jgi:hypothetical protein
MPPDGKECAPINRGSGVCFGGYNKPMRSVGGLPAYRCYLGALIPCLQHLKTHGNLTGGLDWKFNRKAFSPCSGSACISWECLLHTMDDSLSHTTVSTAHTARSGVIVFGKTMRKRQLPMVGSRQMRVRKGARILEFTRPKLGAITSFPIHRQIYSKQLEKKMWSSLELQSLFSTVPLNSVIQSSRQHQNASEKYEPP